MYQTLKIFFVKKFSKMYRVENFLHRFTNLQVTVEAFGGIFVIFVPLIGNWARLCLINIRFC